MFYFFVYENNLSYLINSLFVEFRLLETIRMLYAVCCPLLWHVVC